MQYLEDFIEKNWDHYLQFLHIEIAAKDPNINDIQLDSMTDADVQWYDSEANRLAYAQKYEEDYKDFWVDMQAELSEVDWFDREEA